MANKKITDLNEATSISNNDWLVMVDVANDETKKIHAGEVGGNIPIQDTAPQNPEENDLWIDTSEGEGTNVLEIIYPIGSIIIKADNEDYSSWLGFTWERTLVGRVAVGIDGTDTDFNTIGETGGSKYIQDHYHEYKYGSTAGGNGSAIAYSSTIGTQTNKTAISGVLGATTGNSGNLQPYQVVAYWKRTA